MKIYSYRGKKNLSGDKIREARLKQRLSQSDLAAKVQIAGVTLERDSISRIGAIMAAALFLKGSKP